MYLYKDMCLCNIAKSPEPQLKQMNKNNFMHNGLLLQKLKDTNENFIFLSFLWSQFNLKLRVTLLCVRPILKIVCTISRFFFNTHVVILIITSGYSSWSSLKSIGRALEQVIIPYWKSIRFLCSPTRMFSTSLLNSFRIEFWSSSSNP